MNCDDCVYTDIADWEPDGQKVTPVLWCKRFDKFCNDVDKCPYKAESEGI